MQYVWQHRLWLQRDMRTVDGRPVEVIDPGLLNNGAGPDFFNAKVIIGGHLWAGDVEIHVRASDWHRHGHDGDPAYRSVILHVVDRDDDIITRDDGEALPQLRMPCSPEFHRLYNDMVGRSDVDLPCASTLRSLEKIYVTDWLTAMAHERIHDKAAHIADLVERLGGDWQSACYVTLARALGFGVNGDPFERLALATPLRFIGKHSDSLFTIEALLFGQSGLLDDDVASHDSYAASLRSEYDYMAHKFGLRRPGSLGWKMSRMRPANFPHRRIAVLAAMLAGGFLLMGRITDIRTADDAAALLNPALSGYWEHRYSFGQESPRAGATMSRSSVAGLTINVVVPILFAYAEQTDDPEMADRALDLLQSLPAERNTIVDAFARAGVRVDDAMASQAVIQTRRRYCELHKCLYCRIGHRLLSLGAWRRS